MLGSLLYHGSTAARLIFGGNNTAMCKEHCDTLYYILVFAAIALFSSSSCFRNKCWTVYCAMMVQCLPCLRIFKVSEEIILKSNASYIWCGPFLFYFLFLLFFSLHDDDDQEQLENVGQSAVLWYNGWYAGELLNHDSTTYKPEGTVGYCRPES